MTLQKMMIFVLTIVVSASMVCCSPDSKNASSDVASANGGRENVLNANASLSSKGIRIDDEDAKIERQLQTMTKEKMKAAIGDCDNIIAGADAYIRGLDNGEVRLAKGGSKAEAQAAMASVRKRAVEVRKIIKQAMGNA